MLRFEKQAYLHMQQIEHSSDAVAFEAPQRSGSVLILIPTVNFLEVNK